MKITEILSEDAIVIGMEATEKEAALRELASALAKVKDIGEEEEIIKALLERENLGSTGIGQGIAIPHGKTDKISEMVAVLGVSNGGVNFEALDGEPVYIFFLLVARKDSAGPHLKALAKISRLLRDSFICERLRGAKDAKEAFEIIQYEEERAH